MPLRALRQLGVQHLFGVPGDFNLTLLDLMFATGNQQWEGSPNEPGAGCAAWPRS
ncbi:thiamine pyrophosphate-binding protein [Streptomyces sp. NPDC015242]|uniref:thiamine pyrophosphate-binding protein n=1 Tax=Streptomyces sp. NPDC015242 TaxID=3364951 RepID=UPI0036F6B47E